MEVGSLALTVPGTLNFLCEGIFRFHKTITTAGNLKNR